MFKHQRQDGDDLAAHGRVRAIALGLTTALVVGSLALLVRLTGPDIGPSMRDFKKLRPGMGRDEVERILGVPTFPDFRRPSSLPLVLESGKGLQQPPPAVATPTFDSSVGYCVGSKPVEVFYDHGGTLIRWQVGSGMCFSLYQV